MEKIKGLCRAIFVAALIVHAITWPTDVLPHEKAAFSAYNDLVEQYQQICDKLECKENAVSAIITEQDFKNGISKQDLVERMLAQFQSAKYYEFYTDETLIQVAEQSYEIYEQKKALAQDEIYHEYVDGIRLISAVAAALSLCILLLDWLRVRSKKKSKKKAVKQEIKQEVKEEKKEEQKENTNKETIEKTVQSDETVENKAELNEANISETRAEVQEKPENQKIEPETQMKQSVLPQNPVNMRPKPQETAPLQTNQNIQEPFDYMRHVDGLRNWKVETGTRNIDYLKGVRWDTRVIDHIAVDDFKVNLMRPGVYDLFYHIICKGNETQTITKKYQVEVTARQDRRKQEPIRPARPVMQERPKPANRPQPVPQTEDPQKTIVFNKIEIEGNGSEENKQNVINTQKPKANDFFLNQNPPKPNAPQTNNVKITEVESQMPKPDVANSLPKEDLHADTVSKTISIEDGSITDAPKETAEQITKEKPKEKPKEKQRKWFRKKDN